MDTPRFFPAANARQLDLVEYLQDLGHHPQKIRGNDYWYLSPLRDEKTASFKVNRKLNLWYDHGLGKGGSLIDFGVLYFNCSVKEFLERLQTHPGIFPYRSRSCRWNGWNDWRSWRFLWSDHLWVFTYRYWSLVQLLDFHFSIFCCLLNMDARNRDQNDE